MEVQNSMEKQSEGNELDRFIPNVVFELIPIKDLVSNQEYQRSLSTKHVKNTVKNFDPYQINPVKVSRRDGINYVFNGQHTMEIVATVSGSRETKVWCMVYQDLQYTHEADIFANQQKYVKSLSSYEIFNANVEAGNDKQLFLKKMVESYGLRVGPLKKPGVICAVGALEQIYDKYGHEILARTLRLVIGAWEGAEISLSASMLKGIAKLIFAFGLELKDDVFIDKLSSVSEKEIMRNARERNGGANGYAEAVLMVYNRKLHNPLSIDRIYKNAVLKPVSYLAVNQAEGPGLLPNSPRYYPQDYVPGEMHG